MGCRQRGRCTDSHTIRRRHADAQRWESTIETLFFLPAHACVVYSLRFSVPRTIDAQLHYCYFLMMTTVGAPISGETKNPVGRHLLECTASTSWFYLPYVIVNRGDSCSPDTLQRSFKVGSRDWWKNVQFSFLLNKLVTPRSVLTCEPTIYYIVRAHRHRGRPTLRYSFFFFDFILYRSFLRIVQFRAPPRRHRYVFLTRIQVEQLYIIPAPVGCSLLCGTCYVDGKRRKRLAYKWMLRRGRFWFSSLFTSK